MQRKVCRKKCIFPGENCAPFEDKSIPKTIYPFPKQFKEYFTIYRIVFKGIEDFNSFAERGNVYKKTQKMPEKDVCEKCRD